MAKESMKAREVKRAKLVAKYAEKRAALKKIVTISIIEDFPQRRTPEIVTIFRLSIGNFSSLSNTSNGISFCLIAINVFMTSFLIIYVFCKDTNLSYILGKI